jgi:hypothetical protein
LRWAGRFAAFVHRACLPRKLSLVEKTVHPKSTFVICREGKCTSPMRRDSSLGGGWRLWGRWGRSNPPIGRPHAGRRICFGENHPYKKSLSCAEPIARRKSDNPRSAVIICKEGKYEGPMRREPSLGRFTGHQIHPFTRHLQGSRMGLFGGARSCAAIEADFL